MKLKIRLRLMLIGLIPLLLGVIVTTALSIFLCEEQLVEEQHQKLKIAVEGYTGSSNLYAYKEQNIDITVFEGDTRIESSIEDVVGTKASDVVIDEVLNNGKEYFDTDVEINGVSYYGYYLPTETGMLFAGCPSKIVNESLFKVAEHILLVAVVLIIIVGIIAYFLANRIYKRIMSVYTGVGYLQEGKLNEEYDTSTSSDELGDTVNAVNSLSSILSNVVIDIKSAVETVNNTTDEVKVIASTTLQATDEVSRAVDEIAQGATEQASSAQQMSENIGTVVADVNSIKESIDDINSYSDKVVASSKTMSKTIEKLESSSDIMNKDITTINTQIEETNNIIQQVKGFVDVIEGIASQTNLLALNASIEAARAGEQGRGFAVVANTIKDLSGNTSSQVTQINAIIKELVAGFNECNSSIERLVSSNEEQKIGLDDVLNSFNELDYNVQETNSKIESILGLINEVAKSCGVVEYNIEELAGVSENSAAATEEVNASIEELNALMHNVETYVSEIHSKMNLLSHEVEFFKV